MFRTQAIVVVKALLSVPLALLARGLACDTSNCQCAAMCGAQEHSAHRTLCGEAPRAPMCGTHQGHHALDYGFIAPIAPTAPLSQVKLDSPVLSRELIAEYAQSSVAGFFSAPFEPPRS